MASLIGSLGGALLLLRLPSAAFDAIELQVLIGLGCLLVIIGPSCPPRVAARRERLGVPARNSARGVTTVAVIPVIVLTGAYGGYFGAAQGVLVIAVIGVALAETLSRINALKNVLTAIATGSPGSSS